MSSKKFRPQNLDLNITGESKSIVIRLLGKILRLKRRLPIQNYSGRYYTKLICSCRKEDEFIKPKVVIIDLARA